MYQTVIDFWFKQTDPAIWWQKDESFDQLIAQRFLATHQQAIQCELYHWRHTADGRLAEIIVLDQFSRNIYRHSRLAFANDSLALALAQQAIALKMDRQLDETMRQFLYLPFMHSESPVIHQQAVELYTALGNKSSLDFELQHKNIIDQFGRYPHRNQVLARESSAAELAFLNQPNSSF